MAPGAVAVPAPEVEAADSKKRVAEATAEELKLAQPLDPSEVAFEAWYMNDNEEEDQRLPRKQEPNVPCPPEELKKIGVLVGSLLPETLQRPSLAC